MDKNIMIEVEGLRRASLARLRERHRELFQQESRSHNREQLFRKIAWRLQALAEGDLTERARLRAQEIANDADLRIVAPRGFFNADGSCIATVPGDRNHMKRDPRLPIVGTLLRRQWKGRTILVEVLKNGFRYENRVYPSLSNVAVEVTGTRWNGFAFFGLTRKVGRRHA